MSDTRERARELAGGHYYCEDGWYSCPLAEGSASPDGPDCNCGLEDRISAIQAALESEAALARKEERLECAKAMCSYCSDSDVPERRVCPGNKVVYWVHTMIGFDDRTEDCGASAIHERNLAETGG